MAKGLNTRTRQPQGGTPYRDDLVSWVEEQVALLRAGRLDEVDVTKIAEELSDVGISEYRELESALRVLVQHILKWDHQPEFWSRSWTRAIEEQRERIEDTLERSPGLRSKLPRALERAYAFGRRRALDETGLEDALLPTTCSYTFDDLLRRPFVYDPTVHRLRGDR
jgi:hypothetical protein